MDHQIKKSGRNLVVAGGLGILFFWLTDPVHGVAARKNLDNPVDAMNEAWIGTLAGIVVSAGILLLGLWTMTRRST